MTFDICKTTGLVSAAALMAGAQGVQAQSFDGLYAGISLNNVGGDSALNFDDDDENYQLNADAAVGAFVGYNHSLANGMIVGAELSFIADIDGNDTPSTPNDGEDGAYDTWLLDTKFKLGTEISAGSMPIMLYGFAGVSLLAGNSAASSDYGTSGGMNFGLGAELNVTDKMFVGLELIGRQMQGYAYDGTEDSRQNHTIALRGGFRF